MRIAISRGTAQIVKRNAVQQGQVFAYMDKTGKLSVKRLAHLGMSDAGDVAYSLILAGNSNPTDRLGDMRGKNLERNVKILGSFSYTVDFFEAPDFEEKRRSDLEAGDVFSVPKGKNGGRTTYLHIGQTTDGRFVSVNLANNNHAISSGDTNSAVIVVGTGSVDADYIG